MCSYVVVVVLFFVDFYMLINHLLEKKTKKNLFVCNLICIITQNILQISTVEIITKLTKHKSDVSKAIANEEQII